MLALGPMLDIAVLVPFQAHPSSWVDPTVRGVLAGTKLTAVRARDRFLEYCGLPFASNQPAAPRGHRSLTAVALATSLERAGLRWRVLDPGARPLREWRGLLSGLRVTRPRVVAISSTFIQDGFWVGSLCELTRRMLPECVVAVGGYYYATDANQFLSLDADILCVGEGEDRIVRIAEAVRDNTDLSRISGLYLREANGGLTYTGDAQPLRLDDLPLPDWSLSSRIDPAIDLEHVPIEYCVETQRGCVFKCEFCTYRTTAAPVLASEERAVTAILDAASAGKGIITVVDATGTFPRDRWRRILLRLIEREGVRVPVNVYARVTDLDDEVCELMSRAGVRHVLIGQESGDQRMLDAMRKGTRIAQVGPAVRALGRHRIAASMLFLYGFPGEDATSLANTRRLLATVNDGHEAWPVVFRGRVSMFDAQDLSAVRSRDALRGVQHRFGWSHLALPPARIADEMMHTYLELARIAHAPNTAFGVAFELWERFVVAPGADADVSMFRWAKALDVGIGLFAEQELDGKRPCARALAAARAEFLSGLPPAAHGALRRTWLRARQRATWRVMEEWAHEARSGVGPLTRLALGLEVARITRTPSLVYRTLQSGSFPSLGYVASGEDARALRSAAAEQLVRFGVATGKRKLARVS